MPTLGLLTASLSPLKRPMGWISKAPAIAKKNYDLMVRTRFNKSKK